MTRKWHLSWPYGELDVHSTGGMLGGVKLKIGDRWVEPFYEAPWIGTCDEYEPRLLSNLRSEFACVPFGLSYSPERVVSNWRDSLSTPIALVDGALDESDKLLHGYSSIAEWEIVRRTEIEVEICLEYPRSSPIRRLNRVIRADRAGPTIDFSLTIEARVSARRPFGLHPNLALPETAGSFRIDPGPFRIGFVHPAGPEPRISRAAPGATFVDLADVPLASGGSARFDRLPFPYDTEEIVQLCGSHGSVVLINDHEHVMYHLVWDAAALPSLLLWMSNRGRDYAPWSRRNLCLGVEPLIGAFELGCQASLASNPINDRGIPTALELNPAKPTTVRYRFTAQRPTRAASARGHDVGKDESDRNEREA